MSKRNITTLCIAIIWITVAFLLTIIFRPSNSLANVESAATVILVNEGFEGTFPPAGWTTSGHWGKSNCEAQAGSFSAWAEGSGGITCEGLESIYHPNDLSTLQYGPFSLSDALTATLSFDRWLWSAEGDTFSWGASIDGTNFYGVSVTESFSPTWDTEVMDLSVVPDLGDLRGEAEVWIRFGWETDDFAETFLGVFVDNVIIAKEVSPIATNTPGAPSPTVTSTTTQTATPTGSSEIKVYLPLVIDNVEADSTPTSTPTPTPTVDPENEPPEFPSPIEMETETIYTYDDLGRLIDAVTTITILTPATDPDGDPITYSWSASNGSITANGLTGEWNREISYGMVQGGTVTIIASDGRGGSAELELIFQ
jgi:hypothetical protein